MAGSGAVGPADQPEEHPDAHQTHGDPDEGADHRTTTVRAGERGQQSADQRPERRHGHQLGRHDEVLGALAVEERGGPLTARPRHRLCRGASSASGAHSAPARVRTSNARGRGHGRGTREDARAVVAFVRAYGCAYLKSMMTDVGHP